MIKIFKLTFICLILAVFCTSNVWAVVDPFARANNKVGIGLLSPDTEVDEAAALVNTNGDWGYVLILILKNERNVDRWQKVFNDLNEKKLIPIVRLATKFDSQGYWQKPTDEDARDWADFLSKLHWPTKNRYVQVYNEVNHAQEWGNDLDPAGYAKELLKTIEQLKAKSDDFFVLNAPLDLALGTSKSSLDAEVFYKTMESSVAGIFSKLDGWATHSYPNPAFSASPYKSGRLSILGFEWELLLLKSLGNVHNLPVFITETGWKRSEVGGLDENTIANYYQIAFENIWKDKNIAAITPFVFNFTDGAFNAFSFKANDKVLGKKFYAYHEAIKNLQKPQGNPVRENKARDFSVNVPDVLINKLPENGYVKLFNAGNIIWKKSENFDVKIDAQNAEVYDVYFSRDKIHPGELIDVKFKIKGIETGDVPFTVSVLSGSETLTKQDSVLKSESLFSKILDALKGLSRTS